jgi:hypothetical protein
MITLPKSIPWPTLWVQPLTQHLETRRQQWRINQQRASFQRAVARAYRHFAAQHPRWADSLFDAHFLATDAAALLAKIYMQKRWPGAYELAVAYLAHLRPYHTENVSADLDRIIPVAAAFLNHLRTAWQAEISPASEEVASAPLKRVESQSENEHSFILLQVEGPLDHTTYAALIEAAVYWRTAGQRGLLLDLRRTTHIELSGFFALHSIARFYAGEPLLDPECGWVGLRSAAEQITPAMRQHVKLVAPPPAVAAALRKTAFCSFLEIYDDMETAITAFLVHG